MQHIHQIFEDFRDLNVLIVGDVMVDKYLRGKVERMSPEAPVPIVNLTKADNRLGGAANVALNVKSLGGNPILCGVCGKDEAGHLLVDLLTEKDIPSFGLWISALRKTTVKTRIMADNRHLLRVDVEDTGYLEEKEEHHFLQSILKIMNTLPVHVLLFQDYNKGVLSNTLIHALLREAKKRSILTAADPKWHNFFAYENISLFKPNLKEVKDSLPFPISTTLSDLDRAAGFLREKIQAQNILITLSEKGIYYNDGKESGILEAMPIHIADVCGAGDAVFSLSALLLALSQPLKTIAALSNLAGGLVCEKPGVFPVDKATLLSGIPHHSWLFEHLCE